MGDNQQPAVLLLLGLCILFLASTVSITKLSFAKIHLPGVNSSRTGNSSSSSSSGAGPPTAATGARAAAGYGSGSALG
jgi:hypothetical protein